MNQTLTLHPPTRGLHEFTGEVARVVSESGVESGLCTLFVRHTSASLLIQENADPSARADLERWFDEHVPDGTGWSHTQEGPDDMPGHIRASITPVSLSIPIEGGRLALGTWQGIYLFEHRTRPRARSVVVSVIGA